MLSRIAALATAVFFAAASVASAGPVIVPVVPHTSDSGGDAEISAAVAIPLLVVLGLAVLLVAYLILDLALGFRMSEAISRKRRERRTRRRRATA